MSSTNESNEELLSLEEAVRFLDTSKSTLYRLLNQEEVRGIKVGKQWRFRRADLLHYLERGPAASASYAVPREELCAEIIWFKNELSELDAAGGVDESLEVLTIDFPSSVELLVRLVIELAIVRRASDIHVNPMESGLNLRYRIDGVLKLIREVPSSLHEPVVARLKELTEMNVLEKKLPQDGRARYGFSGVDYDLRVSIIPTVLGESAVIRILNRAMAIISIEALAGRTNSLELNKLRDWMQRTCGMIITTGPTGSGKTTMLYSCLIEIDALARNVATIEDPVECLIPGVLQIQVNQRSGMSHAACLQSVMRHDPDVVMCSEFRNLESAERAIELAVTGHLVLGSLHTESAAGALQRLVDIGLVPFLVCSEVIGVVAMRLTRKLCIHCKRQSDEQSTNLDAIQRLVKYGNCSLPVPVSFFEPVGCEMCGNTGYRGRIPLFEILSCSPELVRRLLDCETAAEREHLAASTGMQTLLADGLRKAAEGATSIDEVLRVLGQARLFA